MTQATLNQIKNMHSDSVLPVIVCDEMLNILWKNDACIKDEALGSEGFTDVRRIFGSRPAASGFFTVEVSNFLYNCNAICVAGKGFVLSLNRIDFSRFVLFSEPISTVFKNMLARLRTSVSTIAVAADEIYRTLQLERGCDKYMANQLNLIEGNLSLLIREVIGAEEIINIQTADVTKIVISIADTMYFLEESVNDLYDDGSLKIETQTEPGILVNVSKSLFETVLSIILEQLLSLPKKVEKLSVRSYINEDGMVEILFLVESFLTAANNSDPDYIDLSLYEKNNKIVNQLKYNFAQIFNGKIEENLEAEKPYVKVILPAYEADYPVISMSASYKPKNTRFNTFISRLALIKKKIRYKEKGE
jgi:hypothetical protein